MKNVEFRVKVEQTNRTYCTCSFLWMVLSTQTLFQVVLSIIFRLDC